MVFLVASQRVLIVAFWTFATSLSDGEFVGKQQETRN